MATTGTMLTHSRTSFNIQYRKYFLNNTKISSDDSRSNQTFLSINRFRSDVISSGAYVSPNENTVSSLNKLH